MALAYVVLHWIASAIIWLCLVLVALKLVWNVGTAYAMLRRGPDQGGWSMFTAIEVVPLSIAVLVSFLTGEVGFLAPLSLVVYGFGGIVCSYLHLFVVLFIGGCLGPANHTDRTEEKSNTPE